MLSQLAIRSYDPSKRGVDRGGEGAGGGGRLSHACMFLVAGVNHPWIKIGWGWRRDSGMGCSASHSTAQSYGVG